MSIGSDRLMPRPLEAFPAFMPTPDEQQAHIVGISDTLDMVSDWLADEVRYAEALNQQERAAAFRDVLAAIRNYWRR